MNKKFFALTVCAIIAVMSLAVNLTGTRGHCVSGNTPLKIFVKTKSKCSKCSCSGYWGYRHNNGTYEGNCSNKDAYGHTCGHAPEKHGLRKW